MPNFIDVALDLLCSIPPDRGLGVKQEVALHKAKLCSSAPGAGSRNWCCYRRVAVLSIATRFSGQMMAEA